MKKHIIYTIGLLFWGFFVNAQETFNLKQCIEKGLEQNYQIRITKNTQHISDNNFSVGNAGFLPTLDLNSSYSGTLNNTDQFPADGSNVIRNNNVNNTAFNVGVNLNWTVFDGFKVFTNFDRLKELQQKGELHTRLNIENFIANLSSEYYNFVQQNIRLNNLKSAVKLSKERLRIVEARYKIGSLSRLDLQQARVDFNADSSKLIRQQEVYFASRIKLNQLMAMDKVDDKINITDTAIHFNPLLAKDELWQQTLKSNVFLLLSEKEKQLSVLDLKTAQSKNYPYLRLYAGYGYTQNKYDISTYRQQNQLGGNYGLTLGFNLFDGFNRQREQRNARIQIENKSLEMQELELSLKSDFSNIWMAYQNNMQLTMLERENLTNAIENYEIAMDRYKLGDLSGIELREAQNSLLEAEERLVQAEYNTKLCEISLMQISGQMTKYLE
jgi:outer membrane protein TolC